ncbi:hypothetical protein PsorP6_013997 [Peronosclerospora sorghi]|uniref:Uncharacterized protein n=1 Tax=Peronosclerospora sorghi TaxID=230839 RepID=A0ACC0VFP4_9STRA|nr:hypothetical protein PsorP6_013997 [Peronosclerospora sorghi]
MVTKFKTTSYNAAQDKVTSLFSERQQCKDCECRLIHTKNHLRNLRSTEVRIIWCKTEIPVEHPNMKGRQQCMRCDDLVKPIRSCIKYIDQFKAETSLVISTEDIHAF